MTKAERRGCTSTGWQIGGQWLKRRKREEKKRQRERDDVKAEKQRLGNSEQGEGVMKMARERG